SDRLRRIRTTDARLRHDAGDDLHARRPIAFDGAAGAGTRQMTAVLDVEGLSIAFGGISAVQGVGFRVQPGEVVSIIGPNGAGKTTPFNMSSGIYQPSAGRVTLHGEDVTGLAPHLLARRGLSRTFQNLQIFQSMSVLENAVTGYHLQERGPVLADLFSLPGS